MTRKDYVKIARIIKDNTISKKLNKLNYDVLDKDNLIYDLCIILKQDNNNFEKLRFMDACE